MTWQTHHRESERYAADAEIAQRNGDRERARELYANAAIAEKKALAELDASKTRTIGISAVSTVSLFYKSVQLEIAEQIAFRWLGAGTLPPFAVEELRSLLQSIWSEQVRDRAGIEFAPGQVMVSVKGGEIVEGGAPLDLILDKVQVVQTLFYRTAELLRHIPHRKRGPPTKEIKDTCRPWLFQTAPGSYQFAVAVQEPRQADMFDLHSPAPKEVSDQFMSILRAGIEDPDTQMKEIVPDADYRETFLKLTRNLAPSGKVFDQLEVRAADETHPICLAPETRKNVNAVLRRSRPQGEATTDSPESLVGILRAVHLDKDWLELVVNDESIKVQRVGETVDDIIGPLVNKRVAVEVLVDSKGRKIFVDIEPEN